MVKLWYLVDRKVSHETEINSDLFIILIVVAINSVPLLGSSPSIPNGRTDGSSITSTGNYLDAPILTSSTLAIENTNDVPGLTTATGTDLIGLDSSTAQVGTNLLTADKNPASQPSIDQSAYFPFLTGQPEAEQVATEQPVSFDLASGDSNMLQGPSNKIPAAPIQVSQNFDIPPVQDPPLDIPKAVATTFHKIQSGQCSYGIYGVSGDRIFLEVKECGTSTNLAYFIQQIVLYAPCLAVKMSQPGQVISLLYHESESNNLDLLAYDRPDFEALLHQESKSIVSRKEAQDETTLQQALTPSPSQKHTPRNFSLSPNLIIYSDSE